MLDQILAASERLKGHANVTPVLSSETLNNRLGAEIFFKGEHLQKVGAFKFRGAFNAISQLSASERAQGVITYSSGNHAQAVAKVGQTLGVKTVIVMPENAPAAKLAATRGYGAEVVLYDPEQVTRKEVAEDIQRQYGYSLIPPFDHKQVIAGQGTVAVEFLNEVQLDTLLIPCGGGGLLSGCAVAAKHLSTCKVIGVEPEIADDAARSFRSGSLQTVHNPPTIADGTRTASLGKLTFPLVLEYVDDIVTVSEQAIMQAAAFLFTYMKQVVEPSGALGLAALFTGAVQAKGRVGVVLSGGNVDAETMHQILTAAQPHPDTNQEVKS